MILEVQITLDIPVNSIVGPFDIYSNADSYATPIETDIPASAFDAPGYIIEVPEGATFIKVQSKGDCNVFVNLKVPCEPTTTTTSTTVAPTTTTTTTATPTTTTTTTVAPTTTTTTTVAPTTTTTTTVAPTTTTTTTLTPTTTTTTTEVPQPQYSGLVTVTNCLDQDGDGIEITAIVGDIGEQVYLPDGVSLLDGKNNYYRLANNVTNGTFYNDIFDGTLIISNFIIQIDSNGLIIDKIIC